MMHEIVSPLRSIQRPHFSALCILFVLLISLLGCFAASTAPTSANTPTEMFEALIQAPLPAEITRLEGTGDTWQGHSIFLRFQCPGAFIASYTTTEFETVSCEQVLPYLQLPTPDYDVFVPSWQPESSAAARCYRSVDTVGQTWSGRQYVLYDSDSGTTYFYGVGQ